MKKNALKAFLVLLFVFAGFPPALAAVDKIPGIPKNADFVISFHPTDEIKEAIIRKFEVYRGTPEYKVMAAGYEEANGVPFPAGSVGKLKNLVSVSFGVVKYFKTTEELNAVIALTFDNADIPLELLPYLKKVAIESSRKDMQQPIFVDTEEAGVTTIIGNENSNEIRLMAYANSLAIVAQKKYHRVSGDVAAALKDEKAAVAAGEKFGRAIARLGKNVTGVIFVNTAVINGIGFLKKYSRFVNCAAVGVDAAADLTKISLSTLFTFDEPAGPKSAIAHAILKKALSFVTGTDDPGISISFNAGFDKIKAASGWLFPFIRKDLKVDFIERISAAASLTSGDLLCSVAVGLDASKFNYEKLAALFRSIMP